MKDNVTLIWRIVLFFEAELLAAVSFIWHILKHHIDALLPKPGELDFFYKLFLQTPDFTNFSGETKNILKYDLWTCKWIYIQFFYSGTTWILFVVCYMFKYFLIRCIINFLVKLDTQGLIDRSYKLFYHMLLIKITVLET